MVLLLILPLLPMLVTVSLHDGGFTAVLTERANGVSVGTLTFNPSTVRAAGSTGVDVTCEGFSIATNNIAVTIAGNVLVIL